MQPSNNEFQPQTNNTPEPQPQPSPPVTPTDPETQSEAQVQPESAPAPTEQPQVISQPVLPQQPTFTPQQPAVQAQQPHDPGKVFNILGLVFAFIALQLPGLILSIIGLKKSKKAGFPTTLSVIGIILNSLFMVVGLGIIAAITMVGYKGVQQRTADQTVTTNATSILKRAEVYHLENDNYPTIDQLRSATGAAALTDEEKNALKDTATPINQEVGYQTCVDATGAISGANVYTYSTSDQQVMTIGTAGMCDAVEQQ